MVRNPCSCSMARWSSRRIRTRSFRNGKTNSSNPQSSPFNLLFQDFIYEIGELETFKGTSIPKKYIVIDDCGLNDITKYELTYEQLGSYTDLVSSI